MPPAIHETIRWCFQNNRWPLYLWGATGTGKSCAAAAAYCRWNPSAAWFGLSELCDLLKSFQVTSMQLVPSGGQMVEMTLSGFWRRLQNVGLVVIDEIGTREATGHRYDAFREVLEVRKGKPLILTGNLDPKDTKKDQIANLYDERILSRIAAGVLLEVKGQDRRLVGLAKRIRQTD